MRLHIAHTTSFTYDQPISEAYTEVRLRPLEHAGQRCLSFQLHTEPREEVLSYTDPFGNRVHHFDVLQPHTQLSVTAESEVSTTEIFTEPVRALSPLDAWSFTQPTQYAPFTPEIVAFGKAQFVEDDPAATAVGLMHAIFKGLKYEKGATTVTTTAPQALRLARGVCQDFAHIFLAACRSQGLAARYVSGYLYSDDAAASHAWVDVFVPGRGWLALDPTHNAAQNGHYVRLAIGRDYADVPPTRGVFKGAGRETLEVLVTFEVVP